MKRILPVLIIVVILGLGSYLFLKQPFFFKPLTPKYSGPVEKITIGQIAKYPDLAIIVQDRGN